MKGCSRFLPMKILLLGFNVQESVFPLGLSYLKSYLRVHHPEVEVELKEFSFGNRIGYETNKNIELQVLSYIMLSKPDVVAFSNYIWSSEMAQDFARAIKQIDPAIRVVLGGVEVDKNHLKPDVDFVITGEGEIALNELVDFLQGKCRIEDVSNVICWKDGLVLETKKKVVQVLDTIPFPYRFSEMKHFEAVRIETSRGCVYSCNFCYYAQPEFRNFSLDYLRENLGYLFSEFTFRNLTFIDANFNTNAVRMFAILDLVEENVRLYDRKIEVHCELRPELLDADMVARMSGYSFRIRVELGFQSSNVEVLKLANRPTNLVKVQEALALLDRSSIAYKIDLMYGLPGDTFFSFLQSMQFLLRNARKQKKVVAHHFMVLNNTTFGMQEMVRFTPAVSSMILKTQTQDTLELYLTKLFVEMVNSELEWY